MRICVSCRQNGLSQGLCVVRFKTLISAFCDLKIAESVSEDCQPCMNNTLSLWLSVAVFTQVIPAGIASTKSAKLTAKGLHAVYNVGGCACKGVSWLTFVWYLVVTSIDQRQYYVMQYTGVCDMCTGLWLPRGCPVSKRSSGWRQF